MTLDSWRFILRWTQVSHSPVWGSLYTGNVTVDVPSFTLGLDIRTIEVHNDYLTAWMLGGAFALILMVWWIVAVNVEMSHPYDALTTQRPNASKFILSLLVLFNGFWATALFNPLMTEISAAVAMATCYMVMHAVARSEPSTSSRSNSDRGHEPRRGRRRRSSRRATPHERDSGISPVIASFRLHDAATLARGASPSQQHGRTVVSPTASCLGQARNGCHGIRLRNVPDCPPRLLGPTPRRP